MLFDAMNIQQKITVDSYSKVYNLHSPRLLTRFTISDLKIPPSHGAGHAHVGSTDQIQGLLITVNKDMKLGERLS